jgi:hypothetical protein
MLRDAVEVAAIVLAGAWALYVFVYQNGIKPGLAPPALSFSVAMRRVGDDGNLAVIRVDETIHNNGSVRAHFLGHSLTVYGSRVIALKSSAHATSNSDSNILNAYYAYSKEQPVFREAFVTRLGDPRTGVDIFVEPGETLPYTVEFYIPRGRFDRLTTYIASVFTKDDAKSIPTTMTVDRSGRTRFHVSPRSESLTVEYNALVGEIDLKAK